MGILEIIIKIIKFILNSEFIQKLISFINSILDIVNGFKDIGNKEEKDSNQEINNVESINIDKNCNTYVEKIECFEPLTFDEKEMEPSNTNEALKEAIKREEEKVGYALPQSYFELGNIYYRNREYIKAKDNILRAISISLDNSKMIGKDREMLSELYHILGNIQCELEDFHNAYESFKNEENYMDKTSNFKKATLNIDIAKALCGESYLRGISSYDEAINLIDDTLSNSNIINELPFNTLVSGYLQIGKIYILKGQIFEAIRQFETGLDISKRCNIEEFLIAEIYEQLGNSYRIINKYKESLEFLRKSHDIKVKLLGKAHSYTAVTYYLFALFYMDNEKYKISFEWANNALKIQKAILVDTTEVAKIYRVLGDISLYRYKFEEAEKQYDLAITLNKNKFETQEYLLRKKLIQILSRKCTKYLIAEIENIREKCNIKWKALSYIFEGMIHIALNHYKEAEQCIQKAKDFVHFEGSERVEALLYRNLGILYFKLKKYNLALDEFEKALNILDKIYCREDIYPSVESLYVYIVQCKIKKTIKMDENDLNEYYTKISQHIESQKMHVDINHPNIAHAYICKAEIECLKGNRELANSSYTYALDIYNSVYDKDNLYSAAILIEISKLDNDVDNAINKCEIARNILQQKECDMTILLDCLILMGKLYIKKVDYNKANKILITAYDLYEKIIDLNYTSLTNPVKVEICMLIGQTYIYLRNVRDAEYYFQEIEELHSTSSYDKVGDLYYKKGYYDNALSWYNKWGKITGQQHANIKNIYKYIKNFISNQCEQASQLCKEKKCEEALKLYNQAKSIYCKYYGNNDTTYLSILENIKRIEEQLEKDKKSTTT